VNFQKKHDPRMKMVFVTTIVVVTQHNTTQHKAKQRKEKKRKRKEKKNIVSCFGEWKMLTQYICT
jgi:hypothetical protein